MRRFLVPAASFVIGATFAWLLVGAGVLGGGAGVQQRPTRKEVAILQVGLIDAGGPSRVCGLTSNPPDLIATHKLPPDPRIGRTKGKAEWIVVGNCGPGDKITINPVLEQGGSPRPNVIKVQGPPDGMPAIDGMRIKADVEGSPAEGDYDYEVLINGAPAQYASPASRGVFEICPEWPCRRSSIATRTADR